MLSRVKTGGGSRRDVRGVVLTALALVVVLALAAVFFGVTWTAWADRTMHTGVLTNGATVTSLGLTRSQSTTTTTILIAGTDYRSGRSSYSVDPIAIAKFDSVRNRVWVLLLPPHAQTLIPGYGAGPLSVAHDHGGAAGTIAAVEKLTGIPINHYAQVNFTGVQRIVDAVGGVWLNVPAAVDDTAAASASPNDLASHIDAGYQLLDGAHALTFVRSGSQFTDPDHERLRNRQLFVRAFSDRLGDSGNTWKRLSTLTGLLRNVQTDLSLADLLSLTSQLQSVDSSGTYVAAIPGTWQSPNFSSDPAQIRSLVAKMSAEQPFDARQQSVAVAAPISPGVQSSHVTVTVHNGSGTSGLAAQCASILAARGFIIKSTGNANQFVYPNTFVVYKANTLAKAKAVAAVIPFATLVPRGGKYVFNSDVLIVVGRDWVKESGNLAPLQINGAH